MFTRQKKIAGAFLIVAGAALAGCDVAEQNESRYSLDCTDASGVTYGGYLTAKAPPKLIQKDGFYAVTASSAFTTQTTTLANFPTNQYKCELKLIGTTSLKLR